MRFIRLFSCSMLAMATGAVATSPPAIDTVETISRHVNLKQYRAVLGERTFAPNARISLVAPVDGSCAGHALHDLSVGSVMARKAFIDTHALQGFIYTSGYDLQPNGRDVSVTWGTTDHQLHRIREGEHMDVPTLAGGVVTVEVTEGQIIVGHQVVSRGGVDVAMNGSVIEIHGCDSLN